MSGKAVKPNQLSAEGKRHRHMERENREMVSALTTRLSDLQHSHTIAGTNTGAATMKGDQLPHGWDSYVNSNFQAVNNSIMIGSTCTSNNPGVHMEVMEKNERRGVEKGKEPAEASDLLENPNFHKDCVFCRIAKGNSPAFKLYEDDMCICFLDSKPLSRGHSLLIPKRHFGSLDTTSPSVIAAMCSKIPFISIAIKKATDCDSFNVLVNNGVAAGQVIFHTHIHIIPRKAHDRLWDSESFRRPPLKWDEAPQLAESIRKQLK